MVRRRGRWQRAPVRPSRRASSEASRHGQRWRPEEVERAVVLWRRGVPVGRIAQELERTPGAVVAKLQAVARESWRGDWSGQA